MQARVQHREYSKALMFWLGLAVIGCGIGLDDFLLVLIGALIALFGD